MILTCPSCGTQYVVKDDAIPPEGRQVRCAACKHSWHQDPEGKAAEVAAAEPAGAPIEAPATPETDAPDYDYREPDDEDESLAEATLIEPRSGPEAEERAYEEAVIEGDADLPSSAPDAAAPQAETPLADDNAEQAAEDWREPPEAEPVTDMFSPFAADDDDEPRRGSPLRTILIVALIIIVLAALFWFLAPLELKARLGLAAGGASPLALVISHRDRQKLESGNELLTVTGRVINPTSKEQDVPPLQARLTNRSGKVVYSWTIAPPTRSLAAGASASFNSAEVNVPPGGEFVTVTVGEPRS